MGAEEEIRELFQEMLEREESLMETYRKLSGQISDASVREKLAAISRQESVHAENVRKMMKIAGV